MQGNDASVNISYTQYLGLKNQNLFLYDASTTEIVEVTIPNLASQRYKLSLPEGITSLPTWITISNNGKMAAYEIKYGSNAGVYYTNLETQEVKRVGSDTRIVDWMPNDDAVIVAIPNASGEEQLFQGNGSR